MERPELTNIFFDQIQKHGKSLLISDYEGTLTSSSTCRERPIPHDKTAERIETLVTLGCRVIIFSEGSAAETRDLLGIKNTPEIWGYSGLERMKPDGTISAMEVDLFQAEGLHQAAEKARAITVPDKIIFSGASLKVSLEDLSEEEKGKLETELGKAWKELEIKFNLKGIRSEKMNGLIARGFDRGSMVREIVDPLVSWSCCYLGDDPGDEDAFRTLWGRGLTALINPDYRDTAAQIWLSSTEELHHFLDEWIWALETRDSDCRD